MFLCKRDLSKECKGDYKDCTDCTLDKIKAKLEQGYCTVNNDYDNGRNYGLYIATQIINMYRAGGGE